MKKLSFIVLLLLAFSCQESKQNDTNHTNPVEQNQKLQNGFYFISNTLGGVSVKQDKRFNENGQEFIEETPILDSKDFQLVFTYDSIIYEDTFAIVNIKLNEQGKEKWRAKTENQDKKKVALVFDSQLIYWFEPYKNSYFQICYCDYSKEEIEDLELKMKNP
jgi:hypothetical protein